MSDRRFLTVLIGGLGAVLGAGLIVLATIGLQDPVHRDLDTGAVTDTSRVLIGLIGLGAVVLVAGAGTAVALVRAQLRDQPR